MPWYKAVLIALDQLLNAIFGGWPDETISSRSWRWDIFDGRRWPRRIIDAVAVIFGDKDHCHQAFLSERLGRQLPPEARPSWRSLKKQKGGKNADAGT